MVKTKCEVYSRVVGYIRPVSNWNDSKQAEFKDRAHFDSAVNEAVEELEHDKQTSLNNEIVHDILRAKK